MKNSVKIVFRLGRFGHGELFCENEKALAFMKYASACNYNLVKVCRGKEVSELYLDKYNNYIYREYEKI